ncbi:MAG: helix-turn-helix domain-containing protein [Chromatiales bacterium]
MEAEIPDKRKAPTGLQNLGDHIGARRHELGLTQRQVAEVLRVNRVTLWYWENHRTEPQIGIVPPDS